MYASLGAGCGGKHCIRNTGSEGRAGAYNPLTRNSWSPPSRPSTQTLPAASPSATASCKPPPVTLALVWLPGSGRPIVPVVPFGVVICNWKTLPWTDHLDEKSPRLVEKPASTCKRSPSCGTIAQVAPASLRICMPATNVCGEGEGRRVSERA